MTEIVAFLCTVFDRDEKKLKIDMYEYLYYRFILNSSITFIL